MAFEIRELTGSLFKNDQKEEETHSDFNGSAKIGGNEYWINCWIKTYEKDGTKRKYYSLSFKPKAAQVKAPAKPAGDFDDLQEIPF